MNRLSIAITLIILIILISCQPPTHGSGIKDIDNEKIIGISEIDMYTNSGYFRGELSIYNYDGHKWILYDGINNEHFLHHPDCIKKDNL